MRVGRVHRFADELPRIVPAFLLKKQPQQIALRVRRAAVRADDAAQQGFRFGEFAERGFGLRHALPHAQRQARID